MESFLHTANTIIPIIVISLWRYRFHHCQSLAQQQKLFTISHLGQQETGFHSFKQKLKEKSLKKSHCRKI
jgi:hypothetical protein